MTVRYILDDFIHSSHFISDIFEDIDVQLKNPDSKVQFKQEIIPSLTQTTGIDEETNCTTSSENDIMTRAKRSKLSK